jgi:hypothetical protein
VRLRANLFRLELVLFFLCSDGLSFLPKSPSCVSRFFVYLLKKRVTF